jgi:hypothetical protein
MSGRSVGRLERGLCGGESGLVGWSVGVSWGHVHQAIRGLLSESFSGMCLKDVTLSLKRISSAGPGSSLASRPLVRVSATQTISLRFLSCLFAELDQVVETERAG